MRPGLVAGEVEKLHHRQRRWRKLRAIAEEGELRHAPGRFEAFGSFREIDARRGLAVDVDEGEVRQVFGEGAEQQLLLLHDAEVLAIDPDEVGAALRSRLHLVAHAAHGFRRVGELHMLERDAVARLQFVARPGDIGVDLRRAGPGIEIDRLPPRLRLDGAPAVLGPGSSGEGQGRHKAARSCGGSGQGSSGKSPSFRPTS